MGEFYSLVKMHCAGEYYYLPLSYPSLALCCIVRTLLLSTRVIRLKLYSQCCRLDQKIAAITCNNVFMREGKAVSMYIVARVYVLLIVAIPPIMLIITLTVRDKI